MRNRTTLVSASIVVLIIAASSVSVQSGRAQTAPQAKATTPAKADQCLARPGATAPKGSHWFYRLERGSNRRCWYLGAAGQRVVRERGARTERAVPTPSPAPAELRADEQTRAEAPVATTAPTSSVAATQFSAAWPVAPQADAIGVQEVPTVGSQDNTRDNAEATAATTVATQSEEMPMASPAVTAAAQPSEPVPGVMHLVIFLSAVAAFVALAFRVVLKLATGQRDRRPAPRPVARPAGPIIRTRAPDLRAAEPSIESMSEPAIARLREIAKRWDTPARGAREPRLPALEVEPDYRIEGPALRRQRVA
jgi:hypothetical protein